jgi:hypothetical protein
MRRLNALEHKLAALLIFEVGSEDLVKNSLISQANRGARPKIFIDIL